jgi:HSP20 family molecular chaperone IbpA
MTDKEKKELEVSRKKEIDKREGEPTREGLQFVPDVDIAEDENGIVLYADLPGVRIEDLDIDVRDGVLTLSASVESPMEHHRLRYKEYEIGGFTRRFNLSERIDPAKISAELNNGVLRLSLPKAEEHKPRKIEIKA